MFTDDDHREITRLIEKNEPLPASLTFVGGWLDLRGYTHPLPASLTSVGGTLYLDGYTHPLPASLTSVGGQIAVGGYEFPLPLSIAGDLPIPIIPQIDATILEAVRRGGRLDMSGWHACETTHCRAGWAIHLGGADGYALEKKLGPAAAGALIYQASRLGQMFPDFFATHDEAMADMIACAKAA